MKEDPIPYTCGKHTPSVMREDIRASDMHKRMPDINPKLIAKLKSIDEWEKVYEDPELVRNIFTSYSALKAVYEDIRIIKEKESCLHERFGSYLEAAGWPE